MKRIFGSRKAVSPVIATIIIVAIAIVMSIAVAYWVLGLGAAFTKYEKVQFTSAYATGIPGAYMINMLLRNTGTATATLDTTTVFLNGVPIGSAGGNATFVPTQLIPGNSTITATISLTGAQYSSGMSVEIMVQTASGSQYPKVIVLP